VHIVRKVLVGESWVFLNFKHRSVSETLPTTFGDFFQILFYNNFALLGTGSLSKKICQIIVVSKKLVNNKKIGVPNYLREERRLLQPKQQEWRRSEIWVSFFDKHSSKQMSVVSWRDISSFLSCSNFSFRIGEKKLYKKYLFNV
jgi:hypothetical protein